MKRDYQEVSVNTQLSEQKPAKAGRSIRRRTLWSAGVLVLAAAALVGFSLSRKSGGGTAPDTIARANSAPDAIVLEPEQRANVLTDLVKVGDLPVRTAVPGAVGFNENRVTPLFAQFAGRVVRLDAEVGQSVRAGQVLGALDSSDIVGIQSDYQRAQADYQQALTAERTARTSLDLATRTRERAAKLAAVEAIPQRELQEAETSELRAKDDLQRAQAAIVAAQSAVAAAKGKLQVAGFTDLDIERLSNGPSAITRLTPLAAPVGGTIVERKVGLGQVVQAGGDALFRIADLSTVWVNADVYEDQLASVRPGARVTIQTPAYPDEKFAARVERVASVVDPEKRTVAVRCVIPNGDDRLKPGMFATIVLDSGTVRRALIVPASAVVAAGNRRTAFVEKEPGAYQERLMETGEEIGGSVVVRSGLREGERVVVQGSLLLTRQKAEARSGK